MQRTVFFFVVAGIVSLGLLRGSIAQEAKQEVKQPAAAGALAQPAPQAQPGPRVQPAPGTPSLPGPLPQPAQPGATPQPPLKRSFKPLPPPANFSPPVIHIAEPDFDWGSVLQGESARHEFVITNKGNSPLTITQVKTSCGCTMASKPDKPIEPGQTGIVALEVDTKRFSGAIKKTADIFSNSQPSPARISIGGKVEAFYTLEPAAPRIDVVRGVPADPVKLTLRRNPSAPVKFTVKDISTPSKVVTAKLTEVQTGNLYEIELGAKLTDDESRKYFYERVNLNLDVNGKVHDAGFNVSVTVKERIDIKPRASVYFSRNDTKPLKDAPGTPVGKSLDIVSLGGAEHKFQITQVTTESIVATPPTTPAQPTGTPPPAPQETTRYFDTKVETVEAGKQYRLTVFMNKLPAESVRTVREKILVKTDDPTIKELTITAMASLY